ncbi:MAG: peptidase domain-containing ABC transporter [Xenococcus sp. (in: cyanobacteria)]
MFKKAFPSFRQLDKMDCGPVCLKIISSFYGKDLTLEQVRNWAFISREGVSLAGLKAGAEKIGFDTFSVLISFEDLLEKIPLPCIIHWKGNHYMVLYRITKNKVYVSDPAEGKYSMSIAEFKKGWLTDNKEGVAMLLEPTRNFYETTEEASDKNNFRYLINYLSIYRHLIWQLVLGLIVASFIQLALPFFTQSIVDYGIEYQDFSFIQVILICQVFFVLSQITVETLRDWILLHVSVRLNIRLMSDYLSKLLQLPVSFFSGRGVGDLVQRINDNERIEEFLTNGSLSFVFDLFNILLFGLVLAYYNLTIFTVFLVGSSLYVLWSILFMKKKARLDKAYFSASSKSQSKVLQLIYNIEDIKVNVSQKRRKREWYETQLELFNVTTNNLKVNQIQLNGGHIINELKNVLIVFLSAYAVINGTISLGIMLAIQFIIGQLNVPLNKLMEFLLDFQRAELAAKRLWEVQKESPEGFGIDDSTPVPTGDISLEGITHRYGPPGAVEVIKNVTIQIPQNKVTAIVGHSGSGKSTLMKLLLGFYTPIEGKIRVAKTCLNSVLPEYWRKKCGVVLQNGHLFDDTIERNITESLSEELLDADRYQQALEFAMLQDLINDLPLGSKTRIGENGIQVSGGEKQRILIARAIYKNPDYFFLDEATSSLDSTNEMKILENLNKSFEGKTVLVIAHRLSTIRNADNIIVLEKGRVVEQGSHNELMKIKGYYWRLIRDQLNYLEQN